MNGPARWLPAFAASWIIALIACGVGCEDKRRHQASEGIFFATVEAPVAEDAGPAEVARAFLIAAHEVQQVREHGLGTPEARERYELAMGRLSSLAARAVIHQNLTGSRSSGLPADLAEDAATAIIAESWVSILAYYADGFLLETLQVAPAAGDPAMATTVQVHVEAERPAERARLEAIEARSDILEAKDSEGRPLRRGSKEYIELVRSATLALDHGFNTPIRARITLTFRRVAGAWRVSAVRLGPLPAPPRVPARTSPGPSPTSKPAVTG